MSTGGINIYLRRAPILVGISSSVDTAAFIVAPKERPRSLLLANR